MAKFAKEKLEDALLALQEGAAKALGPGGGGVDLEMPFFGGVLGFRVWSFEVFCLIGVRGFVLAGFRVEGCL